MKQFSIMILICFFLQGCFIGAGTHGKIKEYYFEYSNEDIVIIVDQFLLAKPSYYDTVSIDNGWVYIKIPEKSSGFGFRIGGESEIVLIAAGNENETLKWNDDLSLEEKEKLTKIFEDHFIEELKKISPKKSTIIKEPFILSSNQNIDTTLWPHYVFQYDTIKAYPLPIEFDSLGMAYFEDLIFDYGSNMGLKLWVNQFHNIFRIDQNYSGFIGDSIYITSFYRTIGQRELAKPIFESEEWNEYISENNKEKRIKNYKKLRQDKAAKEHVETDIYSEYNVELWMLKNKYLNKKVVSN